MAANIPLNAAAVLIWLPPGESPEDQNFNPKNVQPPPPTNPEPWWFAGEAIRYADEVVDTYGKVPWIKIGDLLLSPGEIRKVAAHLRHG